MVLAKIVLLLTASLNDCLNRIAFLKLRYFVNELKLSDFKTVLSKNNIASEFQGGVLFCGDNTVALRRHDSGRVTIEGCVSDLYYNIRELLYEQYAIV